MVDNTILQSFFCMQMYRNGGKEAVYDCDHGIRYTFRDVQLRTYRLANFLKKELKIFKGDRVGILSENAMVYMDTFYSTAYTGAITTAYNTHLMPDELAAMLCNEQPKVLFYEKRFEGKLRRIQKQLPVPHYVLLDGSDSLLGPHLYQQIMIYYHDSKPGFADLNMEDIISLMHTGGTTGIPKAAKLSCRALYFNAVGQQNAWNLTSNDSTVLHLPLFHTAPFNTLMIPLLYSGGRVVLMKKFQPAALMRLVAAEKISMLWSVPSTYRRISEEPHFASADFSALRWCRCGAAPPSLDVMERFWKKGIIFCNGYGMTETGPGSISMPVGSMSLEEIRSKRTSCGKLMPYSEARIIDGRGNEVPVGQSGELLFRGSLLFSGYWNNEEETEKAIPDGWMHTGDIAKVDRDGFYYVVGRKKHIIFSNGENIYPTEIEGRIFEHPSVADTCVIGVCDKEKGEVGKALVVLKSGASLTQEELIVFLKERLSAIQIPVHVQFVDFIPKNSVGKIAYSIVYSLYGTQRPV